MTRLRRLTRFGQSELRRHLARGGTLPAPVDDDAGWSEPFPGGGDLGSFLAWYEDEAGRLMRDDAEAAASFHRAFQPSRRVVCDTAFWAWLAAFPGAGYTEMRWRDADLLSADRVGLKIWNNALASLWWAAEFTRVDAPADILRVFSLTDRVKSPNDPYALTRLLTDDAQLETALLKRVLAQSRTLAVSFVGLVKELGPKVLPSEEVVELARRLHLTGSTVVLDAFDVDRSPDRPYAVSAAGVRACREFLMALLRDDVSVRSAPSKPPLPATPGVAKPPSSIAVAEEKPAAPRAEPPGAPPDRRGWWTRWFASDRGDDRRRI